MARNRFGVGVIPALLVGLSGCGGEVPAQSRTTDDDEPSIAEYCSYGAVSQAQLEGCMEHVTVEQIQALDTNAARHARGEVTECRADAGPFCD